MELLFIYQQAIGFKPETEEPDEGWLGEIANDALRFWKYLEQLFDTTAPPPIPAWTESKQRQRETLKKLAHGQRFSDDESYSWDEFSLWKTFQILGNRKQRKVCGQS